MKPIILSTYLINQLTLAILPAKQMNYDAIIIKQNKALHVRQTPLQLIKTACYNDWTTYEGRREAVIRYTNFKQRVPIPISIKKRIYLFPTHSPGNNNNNWIAYQHIARIIKVPQSKQTEQAKSTIHFKNGQTLTLSISMHTLRKQMERTFECMYRIEHMGS